MVAVVRVTVLGAGSWGTALALLLARNGHAVRLWTHSSEQAALLREAGCNTRYLPEAPFPASLQIITDDEAAAQFASTDVLVVAVPSHAFVSVVTKVVPQLPDACVLVAATKGLDRKTGDWLHERVQPHLKAQQPYMVLSGPSFATEVAAGLPTAVTLAAGNLEQAKATAALFQRDTFRVYPSSDVLGVALGGALKNVLAIASGICDGLALGANARCALLTRGLAEMMRLGDVLGAQPSTLMGLSGVGDLMLTGMDDQSRNRRLGLALGQGQEHTQAEAAMGQVVEGVQTAELMVMLARKRGVDMPICEQVYAILYERKKPIDAVQALLLREVGN